MWNDFSIGNVGGPSAASRIVGGLSRNSLEFWWKDDELGLEGKIAKSTKEGKAITKMIDGCVPYNVIRKRLIKMALASMTPSKTADLLLRVKQKAFSEGEAHRASLIRQAMAV